MIDQAKAARTLALRERWFGNDVHPYRVLEQRVSGMLHADATLLDAGCGRTAPILSRFRGQCARLIGVDMVDFTQQVSGCELMQRDLASTGLPSSTVDVIMSRSVFEHLADPVGVLKEFHRILTPGGTCAVLTANLWDYGTLISKLVPNRFHAEIVARTEGRARDDVFPAHYRCNSRRVVLRCAERAGLELLQFDYLGQYPAYFAFSPTLFVLASGYEKMIRKFRFLNPLLGWVLFTLRKPEIEPGR